MLGIIDSGDVTLIENQTTLARMLRAMAKLTATEMLTQTGGLKPYLSRNEASQKFGRRNVDKWINEGYLKLRQNEVGSTGKMRISRSEIEALAEADDLLQYQITKDNEKRENQSRNTAKTSKPSSRR